MYIWNTYLFPLDGNCSRDRFAHFHSGRELPYEITDWDKTVCSQKPMPVCMTGSHCQDFRVELLAPLKSSWLNSTLEN